MVPIKEVTHFPLFLKTAGSKFTNSWDKKFSIIIIICTKARRKKSTLRSCLLESFDIAPNGISISQSRLIALFRSLEDFVLGILMRRNTSIKK